METPFKKKKKLSQDAALNLVMNVLITQFFVLCHYCKTDHFSEV